MTSPEPTPLPSGTPVDYTGAENLEVMIEARNYNRFLVELIERFIPAAGARLLDFGAGSGTFAQMLVADGHAVTCHEPDRNLRAVLGQKRLPVLERLGDERFDLVYSLNVLEHIEDDVAALHSLAQSLQPGGQLLIYVPAFPVLFGAMDRLVGHHRRYRRGTLRNALSAAGYEVMCCEYADSAGFFATLLYNRMASGDGRINRGSVRLFDRIAFPVGRLLDRLGLKYVVGKNVWALARPRA